MSPRPAAITQADAKRILQAAKDVGAASVEIRVGETTVVVSLEKESSVRKQPVRL